MTEIMKRVIYILTVCLFFTSCKHQISRIGYAVDTKSPSYADCNITIKKFETVQDSVATKIGKVKLSAFRIFKALQRGRCNDYFKKGRLRFKC